MKTKMPGRRWLVVLVLVGAVGCGEAASMDFGGDDGTGGDLDPSVRGGRDGGGGLAVVGTGGAIAGTGGTIAQGTGGAVASAGAGGSQSASSGGAPGAGGATGTGGARAGTGGATVTGSGGSGPLMCEPGTTGKPHTDPCHGVCVNTRSTDVNNCGGCDATCAAGSICHDGACLDPVTNLPTRTMFPACPLTGATKKSSQCGGRKLSGEFCYRCSEAPAGPWNWGYDLTITPCLGGGGVCVSDCNECV